MSERDGKFDERVAAALHGVAQEPSADTSGLAARVTAKRAHRRRVRQVRAGALSVAAVVAIVVASVAIIGGVGGNGGGSGGGRRQVAPGGTSGVPTVRLVDGDSVNGPLHCGARRDRRFHHALERGGLRAWSAARDRRARDRDRVRPVREHLHLPALGDRAVRRHDRPGSRPRRPAGRDRSVVGRRGCALRTDARQDGDRAPGPGVPGQAHHAGRLARVEPDPAAEPARGADLRGRRRGVGARDRRSPPLRPRDRHVRGQGPPADRDRPPRRRPAREGDVRDRRRDDPAARSGKRRDPTADVTFAGTNVGSLLDVVQQGSAASRSARHAADRGRGCWCGSASCPDSPKRPRSSRSPDGVDATALHSANGVVWVEATVDGAPVALLLSADGTASIARSCCSTPAPVAHLHVASRPPSPPAAASSTAPP